MSFTLGENTATLSEDAGVHMSMKKSLKLTALLMCPVLLLPLGCLRNSPTSVAKRFILSIKNLKWDTMVKMVMKLLTVIKSSMTPMIPF